MKRLRKKSIAIILLSYLMLMLVVPITAFAKSECEDEDSSELISSCVEDNLKQAEEDAGIMDGFLIGQANNLFNFGAVNSLNNLIFGNPYEVWMNTDEEIYYGLFFESELNQYIKPLISIFAACYVSFVALSIMIASLKMGLKTYSPQAKADFWTDVQMWIMSAFFMGTFGWIAQIIFSVNEGLVLSLFNVAENQLGIDMGGLSIVAQAGSFTISDILTFLVEWGLALYLNLIYIARKVIIVLLIIMAPIAAISLLYAKSRQFFGTWFKEFLGNVFLQSIHALIMVMFAGLATVGAGVLFKIGMLVMFVPITGMVSKWLNLGDSSSQLGKTMGSMGMAGIAGAAMLTRKAGGVVKGKGKGQQGDVQGGVSGDMGNDNNATNITDSVKGTNSKGWQVAKKGLGFAGAVTGGAIGLGFGGPAGAVAGGVLGKKAVQGVGQAGYSGVKGGKSALNTLNDVAKKGTQGKYGSGIIGTPMSSAHAFGSGLKQTWGDIAERRQFMGNIGESLGGTTGKKIGHAMSGVSQNRIMAQKYGNIDLEDLSKKYPGAKMQMRQTNAGSAMYVQNGDEWQQVSPMGAADKELKDGEVRAVDYQLGSPESIYGGSQGQGTSTVVNSKGEPISAVNTSGPSMAGSQVSKNGSTPHLQRTSEAYIQGADGKKYQDSRVDAKQMNPDQYFSHNVVGNKNTAFSSNWIADKISRTDTQNYKNLNTWRENAEKELDQRRSSGVV